MAIDRKPNQQDLSWFIDLYETERLELNPKYQRKSVWTPKDRRFFLDTIFNNYPCPAIYLQKENTDEGIRYNVVDGKQRIQTLLMFYKNKIRIDKAFVEEGLRNARWSDIKDDSDYRTRFFDYRFTIEQLSSNDFAQWEEVFHRVNKSQKGLTDQELRHARFDGWLVTRAEDEISNSEGFWRKLKVTTSSKTKRMKDVEFVSILMLVLLEGAIVGFPQAKLDELYAKYDFSESEDYEDYMEGDEPTFYLNSTEIAEFENRFSLRKSVFENMLNLSENLISTGKVMTDLYSVWTYICLACVDDDLNGVEVGLNAFLGELISLREYKKSNGGDSSGFNGDEFVVAYEDASGAASTDKGPRQNRLDSLKNYMNNL